MQWDEERSAGCTLMVKAKFGNDGLLIGLSLENVKRLMNGQPIAFELSAIGLRGGRCIIMYGQTEDHIAKDLADGGFLPALDNIKGSA
jgi:hypothetical protein